MLYGIWFIYENMHFFILELNLNTSVYISQGKQYVKMIHIFRSIFKNMFIICQYKRVDYKVYRLWGEILMSFLPICFLVVTFKFSGLCLVFHQQYWSFWSESIFFKFTFVCELSFFYHLFLSTVFFMRLKKKL